MSASVVSAPIVAVINRHDVAVRFPLNHRATFNQDVGSEHQNPSAELTAQFDAYAADYENGVKDGWPDWATKDLSRNATWSLTPKEAPGEYVCQVQFDITNAEVNTSITIETTATGAELTAVLQDAANQAMNIWLAARPFLVPLS